MLNLIYHYLKKIFRKQILFGLGIFALGGALGYFVTNALAPLPISCVRQGKNEVYKFINPLLTCSVSENKEFPEYKPLEQKIEDLVRNEDPNKVTSVSVYYREFITGKWFSINPAELYSPASLLKVPIMIAYYKQAELTPDILNEQLTYTGDNAISNDVEHYKSPNDITPGIYTVSQLIDSMIKNSDNAATNLLYQAMDVPSLIEVMSDIGIHIPQNNGTLGTTDFLTVKSYSYLFRLLYNSTYLSRNMSEKALKLLSYNDFPQGIYGGVPNGIVVAQKFGERTIQNKTTTLASAPKELHDCGIVYYPNHPYLLCVMTKGTDSDSLSRTISGVSQLIYQNIDNRYYGK